MVRRLVANVLAAGALCGGLAVVGSDTRPAPERADFLRPGGRDLTYDPGPASRAPLLQAAPAADATPSGKAVFYRDWLEPSAGAAPLAGPDFDAASCAACHVETTRGRGANGGHAPPRIARPVTPEARRAHGPQVQRYHRGPGAPSARVEVRRASRTFTYANGDSVALRRPIARAVAADGDSFPVALRTAPPLFGWGLLEQVDLALLRRLADPQDRDGDGISGRVARVTAGPDAEGAAVGILGWKNGHAALRGQIRSALAHDMGVTAAGPGADRGGAEIGARELDALADYVRRLGVPDRRGGINERGRGLFDRAGCSGCHVPAVTTRRSEDRALSEQLIWPYSDLLLHDMGPALADPGGGDEASEWRTAPLWGVGLMQQRFPQRGLLHDGRARTIEEAILWHGGEAARARERFGELSLEEREALLAYVHAL